MKQNHKIILILFIFFLALLSFNIFATKILLADTEQYLGVAKEFAHLSHAKVRNMASWVYGFFLGQFLKISPHLITIKILNLMWFVLIASILYLITKKEKTLMLFIFSPLVWYL